MPSLELEKSTAEQASRGTMKAVVFHGPGQFQLEEKPIPKAGPGEAIIKIRLTTICGTDIHIVRGEYPVKPGLTIGHEAVGVGLKLGPGVTEYKVGQRVLGGSAPSLPAASASPAWAATLLNAAVRLAAGAWENDGRSTGRVLPRAVRSGESRSHP